jgi:hypothetical protein
MRNMQKRCGATFLLILASAAGEQNPSPKLPDNASMEQMSSGVLAILADLAGSLFVDGMEGGKAVAGNVLAVKLLAGQHFVDFRDGSGQKVWEKVVSIPAGSQVAERISLKSQPEQRSSGPVPAGLEAAEKNELRSGPTSLASTATNEDFMAASADYTSIEKKIAAYLGRKGLHANLSSSADGKQHSVQLNFRPPDTMPERPLFRYFITALPATDGGKTHLILLSVGTGMKPPSSDAIRSAINEANQKSSCAWFIDSDTELMCRTWPVLPEDYSIPIEEINATIVLINNAWNNLYPKIKTSLK